ncbi:MAG: 2-dehydro-3-deoxy-D-gluconate 5-dehydrogenase KduD [Acidobacteriota bacterium]
MILESFSLSGMTALVTGAGRGLGAAIAAGLAEAGADVACHANATDPSATCRRIEQAGRRAFALTGDLIDRNVARSLVERTVEHFGKLDILINNAGMIRRQPAVEFSEENWGDTLAVHLTSAFLLAQRAARHMIARGSGGRIVNVASLLSFQGGITVPAYAAAKGALAQLTKALANEWASKGVNVNAIAPGYIATDNNAALRADPVRSRQILERIPAGRWGKSSDIPGAVVFLCSPAAEYVHGHVLVVDGGWMGR